MSRGHSLQTTSTAGTKVRCLRRRPSYCAITECRDQGQRGGWLENAAGDYDSAVEEVRGTQLPCAASRRTSFVSTTTNFTSISIARSSCYAYRREKHCPSNSWRDSTTTALSATGRRQQTTVGLSTQRRDEDPAWIPYPGRCFCCFCRFSSVAINSASFRATPSRDIRRATIAYATHGIPAAHWMGDGEHRSTRKATLSSRGRTTL